MDSTINVQHTLSATDRCSLYSWKGSTRLEIQENTLQRLQIAEIDTFKLLQSIKYFLGELARDSDSVENKSQTRLLVEIKNSLSTVAVPV